MRLSMADFMPKHRRTTTGLQTAAWAAKILFLLIGIASTAVLTARFAFPYLLSLVSFTLPKAWNSVISCLAPPYLFITVHFIIMVIWKLHGNQRPEDLSTEPVSNDVHTETISTVHVAPNEPDIPVENPPESEPELPDIQTITTKDTIIDNERSTGQRPWPPPPPQPEMKEDTDYSASTDPDSIDATWKAIMAGKSSPVRNQLKKSDTSEKASHAQDKQLTVPATLMRAVAVDVREFKKSKTFRESTAAAVGWIGRDVLVAGHDELFGKVEAFIKMNYEQMRLQRQESEQRFAEMANAAY